MKKKTKVGKKIYACRDGEGRGEGRGRRLQPHFSSEGKTNIHTLQGTEPLHSCEEGKIKRT